MVALSSPGGRDLLRSTGRAARAKLLSNHLVCRTVCHAYSSAEGACGSLAPRWENTQQRRLTKWDKLL